MTYSEWAKQFEKKPGWFIRFKIWWKPGKGPIDRLARFLISKIKGE